LGPTRDEEVFIRNFVLARAIMRAQGKKQAGFKAELLGPKPGSRSPILFLEGQQLHEQRRRTAPFFTSKAVREKHRALMEAEAGSLLGGLARKGGGDMSQFGMEIATAVTAQNVSLTEKPNAAMTRRIKAFFADAIDSGEGVTNKIWNAAKAQFRLLRSCWRDVQPAIKARRVEAEAGAPRDDVVSRLIA
jgi:hypothetical protein